jgi:hypothetical protein
VSSYRPVRWSLAIFLLRLFYPANELISTKNGFTDDLIVDLLALRHLLYKDFSV